MDERVARRPNLELVKKDVRTSSGLVQAVSPGVDAASLGISTGVLLEGKYLVGRIVGAGAVGIVFEAKNVELDEKVAIKCLRPEMFVDAGVVARFAREAKAAAAIKSEYVATVYDVGMNDEGLPYIVMEYLEGKDLGAVVADAGTVAPRAAVEYALQVCEGLAVAHSKGIVHRDIKPENLLLTERAGGMRIVKVLDFGISKTALTGSIFQNELPLVKTMNLMGTPLYMSPEQVRVSDSVDVRSDIWSLGMVIYEVLTGHTAFGGQSITEICAAILEAAPQPIERYRSDLPSGLVDVINKCLEKDVTKRYQNVAELALALMPFGPKRTRLNVERAVAVLQASGQLDPSVRIHSTMPPSPSDFRVGSVPIPRAPSVPGNVSGPPASDASLGTSTSPSVYANEPSVSLAPGVERKKRLGIVIGAIAAVLVLGLVVTLSQGRSKPAAPDTKAAATELPTSKPIETATAAIELPTPKPVATTSTPSAATVAAAPAVAAKPVATAARPGVPAAPGIKPGVPGAPKPKASGKPNDEPDLGY